MLLIPGGPLHFKGGGRGGKVLRPDSVVSKTDFAEPWFPLRNSLRSRLTRCYATVLEEAEPTLLLLLALLLAARLALLLATRLLLLAGLLLLLLAAVGAARLAVRLAVSLVGLGVAGHLYTGVAEKSLGLLLPKLA